MIAGEDGGGGLLPLLLPPREGDIASLSGLSARCLGDQRAKAADEKGVAPLVPCELFTNYYCYYS